MGNYGMANESVLRGIPSYDFSPECFGSLAGMADSVFSRQKVATPLSQAQSDVLADRAANIKEDREQKLAAHSFNILAHEILAMSPRRINIEVGRSREGRPGNTVEVVLKQEVVVECQPKKLIKDFLGGAILRKFEQKKRDAMIDVSQKGNRQLNPNELILLSQGNTKFLPACMPFPCLSLTYQLIKKIRAHVKTEKAAATNLAAYDQYLTQKAAEKSCQKAEVLPPRTPLIAFIVEDGSVVGERQVRLADVPSYTDEPMLIEMEQENNDNHSWLSQELLKTLPPNSFIMIGYLNGDIDTYINLGTKAKLLAERSLQALELIVNLYYNGFYYEVCSKRTHKPLRSKPIELSAEDEAIFTEMPLSVQYNLLLNFNIRFNHRNFVAKHLFELIPAVMPFVSYGSIRAQRDFSVRVALASYNKDNFKEEDQETSDLHVPIYTAHITSENLPSTREGSLEHPLEPYKPTDTSVVIVGYADGIVEAKITEANLKRLEALSILQLQLIKELGKAPENVGKIFAEYENPFIFLSLPGDMQKNLYLNYDIKIKKRTRIKNFFRNHPTVYETLMLAGSAAAIGFRLLKH